MPQHFETKQWILFPVELVFAFFANPHTLPHIMPPELSGRVEDVRLSPPPPRPASADPARRFQSLAGGTGTEILVSFRPISWLGARISLTAKIVEFEWNSHFADEQVSGPFARFHHRHGIAAETRDGVEGTLVADAIEYTLPGGIFGALAGGIVQKQLEKSFEFRHKRLPEVLAAAWKQASRRS
jgi:ligand-binding SRPBCC domain-containing protein